MMLFKSNIDNRKKTFNKLKQDGYQAHKAYESATFSVKFNRFIQTRFAFKIYIF